MCLMTYRKISLKEETQKMEHEIFAVAKNQTPELSITYL